MRRFPVESVLRRARTAQAVGCRGTDVSNGSGVMVYTVGARAICVELEN
ncbi:hypothetical protein [Streptomyces sp. AJS327]|nr:hypothetical protein [Streptomyces sp. AJS327]